MSTPRLNLEDMTDEQFAEVIEHFREEYSKIASTVCCINQDTLALGKLVDDFRLGMIRDYARLRRQNLLMRTLLNELHLLKLHKNAYGKDEHYQTRQPELWREVNAFLNNKNN